jgi:hypothetical protein
MICDNFSKIDPTFNVYFLFFSGQILKISNFLIYTKVNIYIYIIFFLFFHML